jgi:hypothetical protein
MQLIYAHMIENDQIRRVERVGDYRVAVTIP